MGFSVGVVWFQGPEKRLPTTRYETLRTPSPEPLTKPSSSKSNMPFVGATKSTHQARLEALGLHAPGVLGQLL